MAVNKKNFDQVKQFDTTNLGGQSGPSPISSVPDYKATSGAAEVDQGLSPSTGITYRGIGSLQRGKYRITQISQLNTTESPGTNRDEFDEGRSFNP